MQYYWWQNILNYVYLYLNWGNWDKFLTFFHIWHPWFWRQWFFLSSAFNSWNNLKIFIDLWFLMTLLESMWYPVIRQPKLYLWMDVFYLYYFLQGKVSGSRFFHVTLQTLDKFYLVLSQCLKMLSRPIPSQYLLAQSQKMKTLTQCVKSVKSQQ